MKLDGKRLISRTKKVPGRCPLLFVVGHEIINVFSNSFLEHTHKLSLRTKRYYKYYTQYMREFLL